MNIISSDTAEKFCELCNWAYECWITHKRLFDDNDLLEDTVGKAKYFTSRLSVITQEYVLLQICKLHDPAVQRGSMNLTIDYMYRYGGWGQDEANIRDLANRLNMLFEKIRSARNKLIAHNDLEAFMIDEPMGAFPEDIDKQYFQSLQELANRVHEKWKSGPYPFNDLAEADVDEFLHVLKKA